MICMAVTAADNGDSGVDVDAIMQTKLRCPNAGKRSNCQVRHDARKGTPKVRLPTHAVHSIAFVGTFFG